MAQVIMLGPRDSLVDHVRGLLQPEGNDYSRNAVVFQGKRPAHFLRRAIALARGSAFLPPRIYSADDFVDHAVGEILRETPPDLTPLDAVALLYDLHRAMPRRIGGDHFLEVEAFVPLGRRVFDALEELRMGAVRLPALRDALALSSFLNGDALADLYERFYTAVEEAGYSTRGMRYALAGARAGELALEGFAQIVVAGFFEFSTVERRFLRHLATLPQVTFVFQDGPGIAGVLKALDLSYDSAPAPAGQPRIFGYASPGTHGEVLGLQRILREWQERREVPDERTVIVVPSPDALFPLVEWPLASLDEHQYNISMGYPVSRTPVFGFLQCLLDVVATMSDGHVHLPEYLKFLTHPYTKNLVLRGTSEPMRVLVHALEELLSREAGWAYLRMEDLEGMEELHAAAAERLVVDAPEVTAAEVAGLLRHVHDATIRSVLSATSLGVLARRLIDVLTFVDAETTARLHPLFHPFTRALLEQLLVFAESRLGALPITTLARAGMVLRDHLRTVSMPFHGTPITGLQVLGTRETRNLGFQRVVILDVNDDVLPGGDSIDPLLPMPVRRALGLPLPSDDERAQAYWFSVLLAGAEEVHLFSQMAGGKGRSRFLERILWERQKAGEPDQSLLASVEFPIRLTTALPAPIPKTRAMADALRTFRFTASAIDTYRSCQLRFYYQHLLRLRETGDADGTLDHAVVGNVVHEVLGEMDRGLCGRPVPRAAERGEELSTALNVVMERRFGAHVGPAQRLLRRQVHRRLGEYLAVYDAEVLAAGPVVLEAVERRYACSWEGIRLAGIVDRLERRGEEVVILDYKTGALDPPNRRALAALNPADPATWNAVRSFQLPLYVLLVMDDARIGPEHIIPGYVRLGAAEVDGDMFEWLFEDRRHDPALWSLLTATLRAVVAQVQDPSAPFAPPEDPSSTCPSCPFRTICGTTWVRGW